MTTLVRAEPRTRRVGGPPTAAPGTEIAPGYRVVTHLRRGSDLDIYDAWSEQRYARCVLKTVRPDRTGDIDLYRRLGLEARLLLASTHPHLVRAYELIRRRGAPPMLVLETLSGETVGHLLNGGLVRLTVPNLAHLGRHLCSAIRYLHGLGYLHLDVKPSNIIAEAGRAKLIDLSLARRPGRCRPGYGTAVYLAPEQALGGLVGPPADVWGIGLVLYEAATGRNPFDPDEPRRPGPRPPRRYRQLTAAAPAVGGVRRLPRPIAAAVDGCLRRDPARRPGLAELIAALETVTGRDLPPS